MMCLCVVLCPSLVCWFFGVDTDSLSLSLSLFSLLSLSLPSSPKMVIDSIIWAFRHTDRGISDIGLEILDLFLSNVSQNQEIAQSFYQQYYLTILQDLLYVLTDRLHKSSFKWHATLLQTMFRMVEADEIQVNSTRCSCLYMGFYTDERRWGLPCVYLVTSQYVCSV